MTREQLCSPHLEKNPHTATKPSKARNTITKRTNETQRPKPKSKALIEDLNMNKFYLIDNQRESEGWGSLVWQLMELQRAGQNWVTEQQQNGILCLRMAEYTLIPRNMKHSQKLVTSWTTLYKSQRIEILCSDHGTTKLVVNNRKMPRNFPYIWKLRNTLLKNPYMIPKQKS